MDQQERYQRLQDYLAADPNNLPLLLEISWLSRELGDKTFMDYSDQVFKLAPDTPEALYLKGTVSLDHGDFDTASVCFQKVLANLDNEAIRYSYAFSEACANRFDNTLTILKPIAESMQLLSTRFLYAKCLYANSDVAIAEKILMSLLSEFPDNVDVLSFLALLHSDLNAIAISEEYIARALKLDPQAYDALIAQANNRLNEFEFDLAEKLFHEMNHVRPPTGRSAMGLGLIAMGRADPAAAEPYLRDTVKYMPTHLGSWNALGWCLIVQNKLDDSITVFQKAIEINGAFAESQGGMACALVLSGKKQDAEKYIKLGKRLDPNAFAPRFAEILLTTDSTVAQRGMQSLFTSSVTAGGPSLQELLSKFAQIRH